MFPVSCPVFGCLVIVIEACRTLRSLLLTGVGTKGFLPSFEFGLESDDILSDPWRMPLPSQVSILRLDGFNRSQGLPNGSNGRMLWVFRFLQALLRFLRALLFPTALLPAIPLPLAWTLLASASV